MTSPSIPTGSEFAGEYRISACAGRPPAKGMAYVTGGSFMMGSNEHYPEETPAHTVSVNSFWMDQFTVTNAQFSRFIEDTGYVTSAERPPRAEDFPGAKPELLIP